MDLGKLHNAVYLIIHYFTCKIIAVRNSRCKRKTNMLKRDPNTKRKVAKNDEGGQGLSDDRSSKHTGPKEDYARLRQLVTGQYKYVTCALKI